MGRPIVTEPEIVKVSYDDSGKDVRIDLTNAKLYAPTNHGVYGEPYIMDGGIRFYLNPKQFRKAILEGKPTLVVPSSGREPRMIVHTDHDDDKFCVIVMLPVRPDSWSTAR